MSMLGLEALSLGGLVLNVVSGFCSDHCKRQINHWLKYQNHDVPRCLREAWQLALGDVTSEAIKAHSSKLSSCAIENIKSAVAAMTTKEACTRLFPDDLTFVNRELLGMPGHNDPLLVAEASGNLVKAFAATYAANAPMAPLLPAPFLDQFRADIFRQFSRYFIETAFKHDEAARAEIQLQLTRWHSEMLIEIKGDTGHTRTKVDKIYDAVVAGGLPGRASPPAGNRTSNFVDAAIQDNPLFKGRSGQLDRLAAHFAQPTNDAGKALTRGHIVIVGEGGMGKSQLAQRYAEMHAADWDGRWWIDASPLQHDASLRRLVEFLGLSVTPNATAADRRAALRNHLYGGTRHLIILDSFEASDPKNPSFDLLRELDPGAPACLLITTRDGNLPDQFGPHLHLPVLDEDAAISLLRRDTPRLQLTGDAAKDAAMRSDLRAVCVHLGFHALAVDLAGANLRDDKGLSPAALLADLKSSDTATLALFEREGLRGKAHRYAASVGQTLSRHLAAFTDDVSRAVLSYIAYHAPDTIDPGEIAATHDLPINAVRECLVRLAGVSILKYAEGGEHGIAKVHVLMQIVLRVVLFDAGNGASGGAAMQLPSPLPIYLAHMRETFADPAKHELYLRRTRLLPHAQSLLGHAEGGRSGPQILRAAALLRAELAIHRSIIGDLRSAEADIARSIVWGEAQTPRDEASLAIWHASRASIRQDRGDLQGAEADIAASIAWGEAQTPRDERSLAIWYASRASIRKDRGDLQGAEADIARSIAWGDAQTPRDERSLAIDYASRASIRQSRGDLQGAEADIARSIAWEEAQTPRDERSLAIRYSLRASIRQDRGDLQGAETDIARSIAWGDAQTPRDERSLAIWYASRASIRQDRGDLDGAEADIATSIAWGEAQTLRNERSLAIDYASRASIRQSRGDLQGAEADIARSIAWGEAQTPRDERSLAIDYASRASIRQSRGDLQGAEADIAVSITWGEAQTPRDERSLAIRYSLRASIRQDRGDIQGAEADIARSISWGEAQTPRDERSLAIRYSLRASIRQHRGDLDGAEADIATSIAWGEAQTPRNERSLAILYASRGRIRRDLAIAARRAGDANAAAALFEKAKVDIAAALAWFETNLPTEARGIALFRKDQARIEQSARDE